jgi:hypothetical protein
LHFPPFCSKSHEETMVSHWLIDSSSSALSSQHPQTLRFFPREVKNIKHDRYFPQGLERSNPHENYPHTRETCSASCHAKRLAQQVALVCGRLKVKCYRLKFYFALNFKIAANHVPREKDTRFYWLLHIIIIIIIIRYIHTYIHTSPLFKTR